MQDHEREVFLRSRDRHPPNDAITFIEQHLRVPGETSPVFSERNGSFVPLEEANRQCEESKAMWHQVDNELEALFDLMQKAQARLYGKPGRGSSTEEVASLRQCRWSDVMVEVQRTAFRWKSRPDKQSKTMVFIDKVGQHSASLESWLGLLPMGDYGSSICGVFKLALGAAGQYEKVEEAIFEALSEIPRVMESAWRYVEMYRRMKDQFLEKRTFELFRAILKLLRHIMKFFADSKSHKLVESILKQRAYKEELFESVGEIKTRAQAVNDEAQQCQGRLLLQLYERGEQTAAVFQRFMEFLATHPRFISEERDLANIYKNTSRLEASAYDRANVDHAVSSDDNREIEQHSALKTMPLSKSHQDVLAKINRREAEAVRDRLLQCLQYDPESLLRDIDSSLRHGYQLEYDAKSRAAAAIQHRVFRSFMEEVHSSTYLLLNGRDDISTSDGCSPLSIVVAELARISKNITMESSPVFVVQYFCAAHSSPPSLDPAAARTSSSISMMCSLIGQLVGQLVDRGVTTDLSFLTRSRWRKLERLEAGVLCLVFRRLTYQMPPGSVLLCVIDEISLYETQFLENETDLVMEKLVRLASKQRGEQQVFKLLVTCQDHALGVSRYFGGHTLDLPEEIEGDDSVDWAISNMAY